MTLELVDGHHGGVIGPSPSDPRNFRFADNLRGFGVPAQVPAFADLFRFFRPVGDQGRLGSCVGWSIDTLRESVSLRFGHARQPLSPQWLYQESTRAFWDYRVDSGVYIHQGMRILRGRGIAPEPDYPYDPAKYGIPILGTDNPLPALTYGRALAYRNVDYYAVHGLQQMLQCLASGHPFVFGFLVRTNFIIAADHGEVPMPSGLILGAHAVCAGGYMVDASWPGGGFIEAQNSWGLWTRDGHLRFPFAMMDDPDHAWDCWTLRLRTEAAPGYLTSPDT